MYTITIEKVDYEIKGFVPRGWYSARDSRACPHTGYRNTGYGPTPEDAIKSLLRK